MSTTPTVRQSRRTPANPANYKGSTINRSSEKIAEECLYSAIARLDNLAGHYEPRSDKWIELRQAKQLAHDALSILQRHIAAG